MLIISKIMRLVQMMMMQLLMTTMMYTSILALSATTLSQDEVDLEEGSTKRSRFTWQVITPFFFTR